MHDHGVLNRAELGWESPFGLLESKHHAATEHFQRLLRFSPWRAAYAGVPLSSRLPALSDTKGVHLLPKGHESCSLGATFGQVQINPSIMTHNLATPVKEPLPQGTHHGDSLGQGFDPKAR
jgi:hypothetical protein